VTPSTSAHWHVCPLGPAVRSRLLIEPPLTRSMHPPSYRLLKLLSSSTRRSFVAEKPRDDMLRRVQLRPRDDSCRWKCCCHSKSLKVIRIYTVDSHVCEFLLAFHCNYVFVLYCFWNILHRIMSSLEILVRGQSSLWKWQSSIDGVGVPCSWRRRRRSRLWRIVC